MTLFIIAQAQFFHCSRGKGADETTKFRRNSCPPILAMKKLGVLLLVSSIEYFDHFQVNNYAGNGFEKSLFFSLSQHKSANIDICTIYYTMIENVTLFQRKVRQKLPDQSLFLC